MNAIERAFQDVPRSEFLPEGVQIDALRDRPLSIGYGQTNSQPSTVRAMLQWLDVQPGDNVLDVGSGSGWTTALLTHLVGDAGRVEAVEIVPQLVAFGRDNCERLGIRNAAFHQAQRQIGWPQSAPYDRILVSASAAKLPALLLGQLKVGGSNKMVIPVGNEILEISIGTNGEIRIIDHPGFIFVPLLQPQ